MSLRERGIRRDCRDCRDCRDGQSYSNFQCRDSQLTLRPSWDNHGRGARLHLVVGVMVEVITRDAIFHTCILTRNAVSSHLHCTTLYDCYVPSSHHFIRLLCTFIAPLYTAPAYCSCLIDCLMHCAQCSHHAVVACTTIHKYKDTCTVTPQLYSLYYIMQLYSLYYNYIIRL